MDWWETVNAVGVDLEGVTEDAQRGFIDHDTVDSNVECVCATTKLEHDAGNGGEFVEAGVGVRDVRQRHVIGLLVSVRLIAEVHDGGVANADQGMQKLALLFFPVEYYPERTVMLNSLLEGPGHLQQLDLGDIDAGGALELGIESSGCDRICVSNTGKRKRDCEAYQPGSQDHRMRSRHCRDLIEERAASVEE